MKYPLLLSFLFIVLNGLPQNIDQEYIVREYAAQPSIPGIETTWLKMDFDRSQFLNQVPKLAKSLTIERIDLVYSDYQESESFNQKNLNLNRIKQLISEWPATKDRLIDWRIIGQSNAMDNESARNLFHGFVVYYRPEITKESTLDELHFMDEFVSKVSYHDISSIPSVSSVAKNRNSPKVSADDIAEKLKIASRMRRVAVSPPEDENAKLKSMRNRYFQNECYRSYSGIKNGSEKELLAFIDKINIAGINRTGLVYHLTSTIGGEINTLHYIYYDLKPECDTSTSHSSSYDPRNSDYDKYKVVQDVFNRNAKWNNSVVVMDVTGSMARYSAQTMSWVRATQGSRKIQSFVFFNDGDSTQNEHKKSGNVGGIYGITNASFDKVKKSMLNGSGGDRSENNFEAVIRGKELFPNSKETILIADNRADPRDYQLVKSINSPLHIILCGAHLELNIIYIQAAFDTGGSIHTSLKDYDMSQFKQGVPFSLGEAKYGWNQGRIIRLD